MQTYRVSALASAAVRMWRGWSVIVPVVVVNALVQALLVWPAFTYGSGWYTALSAVLSAVVFGLSYGVVASVALDVPIGRVGWAQAWSRVRSHLGGYALWAVLLLVVVSVGLAVYTVPGLLVLALTPFLLIAALDGRGNALAANVRTIGRRFWRWLVTVAITGIGVLLGSVIAGFTAFFWRGGVAAVLVWLVGGLLLSWITVAWGLIYRSAWLAAPDEPAAATPDVVSIVLVEHDPAWAAQFQQVEARILAALGDSAVTVEHAGSTSVPGLAAKPILDVVLVVPDTTDEGAYVPALEGAGFTFGFREPEWFEHRLLRGTDPSVNLHVFSVGCPEVDAMIAFRDHLRTHPEDRNRYERTKRDLAGREWGSVQDYADAKTEIVRSIQSRIDDR